jgi:hypothetical protein
MTYLDQLYPWCIIRPLPHLQRRVVARFRRRHEAEAHLQVIKRLVPHITYSIIFDPVSEPEKSDDSSKGVKHTRKSQDTLTQTSGEHSPIFPDGMRTRQD